MKNLVNFENELIENRKQIVVFLCIVHAWF